MIMNKRKKQKVETFLLWNENILYEIVSFIKKPIDFIHLAETCKNFYNWTIGNEITLNLMFKKFKFYHFPSEVPNYLLNLKHLDVTQISDSKLRLFTKLESLFLYGGLAKHYSVSTFENFTNLKRLRTNIFRNDRNFNFEIFKEKLEELDISGTQVEDKQIICLRNLTKLRIGDCSNISGECLQFFTKLKKLVMYCSKKVTDAHLQNLVHLEHLYLYNCSKVNGLFLEKLTKLKYLDLRECNTKEITKMKLPNSLEGFEINGTNICDEQLQHLENLTSLEVNNCNNLNGTYLKNKKKLKLLHALDSGIIGENISLCTNLTELHIGGGLCQVKDEHFQNLKKLKRLKIDGCDNLTDAIFLNLLNLKYLDCSGCERIEGHNFKELKKLHFLSINGGNVLEENLSNLSYLDMLCVSHCPSFTGNCLLHLPQLSYFNFIIGAHEREYCTNDLHILKRSIEAGKTLSYNEDDDDESVFGTESGDEEELEEMLSEEEESDASQ